MRFNPLTLYNKCEPVTQTAHDGIPETMKPRILLINSEADTLQALKDLLDQAGYEVATADNVADGQRLFDATYADMVVLDSAALGTDGLALCRHIREMSAWTAIIMLTARDKESDVVKGLEAGADRCVARPVVGREFLARIAAVLRQQRAWAARGHSPQPQLFANTA